MSFEEIKTVKEINNKKGYLINNCISFVIDENSELLDSVKQWVKDGGIIEPEFTEEEIIEQEETKARLDRKNLGIDYTNLSGDTYKVSLTSEDANGLIQVKTAFEFGITETNFECSNGTIVPIKSLEDLLHLGEFVVTERNKFFV